MIEKKINKIAENKCLDDNFNIFIKSIRHGNLAKQYNIEDEIWNNLYRTIESIIGEKDFVEIEMWNYVRGYINSLMDVAKLYDDLKFFKELQIELKRLDAREICQNYVDELGLIKEG